MYTQHGHQIPGTPVAVERPPVMRCGGFTLCKVCQNDATAMGFELPMVDHPALHLQNPKNLTTDWEIDNLHMNARAIVRNYITRNLLHKDQAFHVNVVWFSKTLQNWKALVTTSLKDNMYYEITHNGDKHESYLDVYMKVENVTIGPNGDAKHGGE